MAKSKAINLTQPITVPAMPHGEPKDGSEKDYEANNAADTIMKAHEHMANEDLMPRVHKVVGRKMKALAGVHAIKDGGLGSFDPKTGLKGLKAYAQKIRATKNDDGDAGM